MGQLVSETDFVFFVIPFDFVTVDVLSVNVNRSLFCLVLGKVNWTIKALFVFQFTLSRTGPMLEVILYLEIVLIQLVSLLADQYRLGRCGFLRNDLNSTCV